MTHKTDPRSEHGSEAITRAEPAESSAPVTELTDSDLNRYHTYDVPADVRKQWIATKLPSLDPRVLEDTLPPNAGVSGAQASSKPSVEQTTTTLAYTAEQLGLESDAASAPPESKPPEVALLSQHRRKWIVVVALSLLVLGVPIVAFLSRDKGVTPAVPTSTEGRQVVVPPSVGEPPPPALSSPNVVDPTRSAHELGSASPPVPPTLEAPPSKVERLGSGAHSSTARSEVHKSVEGARDDVPKPSASPPPPPVPSATSTSSHRLFGAAPSQPAD